MWRWAIGLAAVGALGVVVFMSTREASAKNLATKAFRVDGCVVTIVDRDAAQAAAMDAGAAAFRGTSERAEEFATRGLGILFPGCSVDDLALDTGSTTIAARDAIASLGDMTVGDLVAKLRGDAPPGVSMSRDGTSPAMLLLGWMAGGSERGG